MTSPALAALPEGRTFTYKTDATGHEIGCDVYVPSSADVLEGNGAPILIFIRMSGFMCFSRDIAGAHWAWSGTTRGYVVINVDHRLAPQVKVQGILEDILDACAWARETLPRLIPEVKMDPTKLVVAGGSAGAHLALLTGHYLTPPPLAIVSLYPLADPTAPGVLTRTFPNPPRGRTELIPWSEVAAILDESAPVESHSRADDLDLATCTYKGRGAAMFYAVVQEGLIYPTLYGTDDVSSIRDKFSVPHLIQHRDPSRQRASFPPTFLIHSRSDSYNAWEQSQLVADALAQYQPSTHHELWVIDDDANALDRGGTGAVLEHNFDGEVFEAGERRPLERAFAKRVWDGFLGPMVGSKAKAA